MDLTHKELIRINVALSRDIEWMINEEDAEPNKGEVMDDFWGIRIEEAKSARDKVQYEIQKHWS